MGAQIREALADQAVVLRIDSESTEAVHLSHICPLAGAPLLAVIGCGYLIFRERSNLVKGLTYVDNQEPETDKMHNG